MQCKRCYHLSAVPSFFNSLFLASKALKTISLQKILSTARRNFSFSLLRIGSIPLFKRSRQAVVLNLAFSKIQRYKILIPFHDIFY
ncbi:hypothetical protein MCO_01771 [Bartonella sp. DB5-6]|nr:hypothetical protein MCO_01771 [Bartonella sp. DB5-6]